MITRDQYRRASVPLGLSLRQWRHRLPQAPRADSSSDISIREVFTARIYPVLKQPTSYEVGHFIICLRVRFKRHKAVLLKKMWIRVASLFVWMEWVGCSASARHSYTTKTPPLTTITARVSLRTSVNIQIAMFSAMVYNQMFVNYDSNNE